MKKSETAALLTVMAKAYPNSKIEADEDTVSLWHEMLGDLDCLEVTLAVKAMIATLKFPPAVADVRESVCKARRTARGELSPGEAWGAVRSAMGRYGYYQPEKARAALGEKLWSAVKMVGGWSHLCSADNEDVISAQFERRYQATLEQAHYDEQVPARITQQFRALTEGMQMHRLESGGGAP